jgi:hypothetical protein
VLRAHGSKLVGAEIGTGDTWAVMLHQSDALAMCGWWEYAVWLAEDYQVHVLLFDFCMFGDSQCNNKKIEHDQIAQASLAGTYARRHGARRLTFVGASMGGSVAPEAALATKADAVIDLSGPTDWSGTDINRAALRLAMPTLMAISPDDGEQAVASFRRAYAKVAASHKRLYVPKHGHGYTLLSELGEPNEFARTVASWIVGKY